VKIRQLLAALAAAALSIGSAQATLFPYMFAGTSAGGVGSATMIVDDAFSAQNILVQLFNTSPLTTVPGGNPNAPAITGRLIRELGDFTHRLKSPSAPAQMHRRGAPQRVRGKPLGRCGGASQR
jgi:hypothetical protein